jgi:hypothetical protein
MADTSQRSAGIAGLTDDEPQAEGFSQEETELAKEFRDVLRDIAGELAQTVAEPSVGGVAQAVRRELSEIALQLRDELSKDIAALRQEQTTVLDSLQAEMSAMRQETSAQVEAVLTGGTDRTTLMLVQMLDKQLKPVTSQMESLEALGDQLRDGATSTGEAARSAAQAITDQAKEFARAGDGLRSAISSTASQLGEQANELRTAISSTLPVLDSAARGVSTAQDSLRTMLRTYNETLERSLTALETKFAGLLAANLERVAQRQSELEAKMRATAERTEEAVIDLMSGNEAHHQAMIEGTAANLSQLEMFAKSQHKTASAVSGLFYLSAGAIAGLVFVSYLLLVRG